MGPIFEPITEERDATPRLLTSELKPKDTRLKAKITGKLPHEPTKPGLGGIKVPTGGKKGATTTKPTPGKLKLEFLELSEPLNN